MIPIQEIHKAGERISGYIRKTPVHRLTMKAEGSEQQLVLKLENLQYTGSFKIRGAANKMLNLNESARAAGVIAVSTGNHGRAVAAMASHLGIRAVICLSEGTAPNKVAAIESLGPEVRRVGQTYDEATVIAKQRGKIEGLTFIEPFDDPEIIAGQGTIGLELLDFDPSLDAILVPMSGGGLISGIGIAYKHYDPEVKLVGVSMGAGAVMGASLEKGHPVKLSEEATIADALVGGLGKDNQYTFSHCQELVDTVILLSEEEITGAIVYALQELHLLVEGGGVVGLAAVLFGKARDLGERLGIIISGGNIDLGLVASLIQANKL